MRAFLTSRPTTEMSLKRRSVNISCRQSEQESWRIRVTQPLKKAVGSESHNLSKRQNPLVSKKPHSRRAHNDRTEPGLNRATRTGGPVVWCLYLYLHYLWTINKMYNPEIYVLMGTKCQMMQCIMPRLIFSNINWNSQSLTFFAFLALPLATGSSAFLFWGDVSL